MSGVECQQTKNNNNNKKKTHILIQKNTRGEKSKEGHFVQRRSPEKITKNDHLYFNVLGLNTE